jgi:peptidase M15-like protein
VTGAAMHARVKDERPSTTNLVADHGACVKPASAGSNWVRRLANMRKCLIGALTSVLVLAGVPVKADTVSVLLFWPYDGIWIYYDSSRPQNLLDVAFWVYCGWGCSEYIYGPSPVPSAWIHDPVNHNHYSQAPEWYYQAHYSDGEVGWWETASGNARAVWNCGDRRSDLNQEYVDSYSGGSVYLRTGYLPNCGPWDGGWAQDGGTPHFSWSELNGDFSTGNPNYPWGIVRSALKNGLEATRTNYNRGGIRLSSGYRTPRGNQNSGGVFNSYHVHGRAADMYSADNPWTEEEFNLLKNASLATNPKPVESLSWNTYPTNHHYHAAW